MKPIFAPQAQRDLRRAISYLFARNPSAAIELKNELLGVIESLAGGEFEGAEVQLRSGRWVRSWPVPPYRLYYQRSPELFRVIRVYDQRRRPITRR